MQDFFGDSLFFGMAISVLGYELGRKIKTKWRLAIFNPLLIAVIFVMVVLKTLGISYDSYNNSAKYLSYLLTPATVCLAIPLYQQMALLREQGGDCCGARSGSSHQLVQCVSLVCVFWIEPRAVCDFAS